MKARIVPLWIPRSVAKSAAMAAALAMADSLSIREILWPRMWGHIDPAYLIEDEKAAKTFKLDGIPCDETFRVKAEGFEEERFYVGSRAYIDKAKKPLKTVPADRWMGCCYPGDVCIMDVRLTIGVDREEARGICASFDDEDEA
jgi:hypothetical protein